MTDGKWANEKVGDITLELNNCVNTGRRQPKYSFLQIESFVKINPLSMNHRHNGPKGRVLS